MPKQRTDPVARLRPGPGGLYPGFKWVSIRTDAGNVYRVQWPDVYPNRVPAGRRKGAGAPAAPSRTVAPQPRPPWPTGRYVVLSAVPALRIPRDVRRAAQEAADACSDDLGIARRPVRYFDEATPGRLAEVLAAGAEPERFDSEDCLGIFRPEDPNAIYVRATDDVRQAVEAAAHETKHRQQWLRRGPPRGEAEREAQEAEALSYGEHVREWHDANGGDL